MYAWKEDRLSDDIVAEQKKLDEAELIIFQVRGQAAVSFSVTTTVVLQFDCVLAGCESVTAALIVNTLMVVCSSRCTGSASPPS